MKTFRLQRGQFLVAGIVLIVVIALMIATLGYLYVSGESGGALHGQSERAYFAARSGIEYSKARSARERRQARALWARWAPTPWWCTRKALRSLAGVRTRTSITDSGTAR